MANKNRMFPYFRLTDPQKTISQLDGWFEHLEKLGIPCAMVEGNISTTQKEGFKPYSLWRMGEENVNVFSTDGHRSPGNNERLTGKIVKECHGFAVYLEISEAVHSEIPNE